MAKAEAERIKVIGAAEAIQKVRTAKVEGYRAIVQATAGSQDKKAIVRLVGLSAAASVAHSKKKKTGRPQRYLFFTRPGQCSPFSALCGTFLGRKHDMTVHWV